MQFDFTSLNGFIKVDVLDLAVDNVPLNKGQKDILLRIKSNPKSLK